MSEINYSKTLNLPKTNFNMKANLPEKEKAILKKWYENKTYEKSLEKNKDCKSFVFLSGPPYANGNIHVGTALNVILKDILLKSKRVNGYYARFIPGWDTHGLPIEYNVAKELGTKFESVEPLELRKKCTEYALKYLNIQRDEFKRLGAMAEWDTPYVTLDPTYEYNQLIQLAIMSDNGYVFNHLKSVYWCAECKTALAEAEIKFKDHESDSIFVKFELNKEFNQKFNLSKDIHAHIVIWTTTPWTLPGNMAISVNEEFEYSFLKVNSDEVLILATELLPTVVKELNINNYEIIGKTKGSELEHLEYVNPLFGRTSPIILSNHVTLTAGTGCVHTAPAHGPEDFVACQRYNIEAVCPVDSSGCYNDEVKEYKGIHFKKANRIIIEKLLELGHILKASKITHSYPHCWRCKNPIIFRSTPQWFVSLADSGLKEKALKALDSVTFTPESGANRMRSMLELRPDWCISRQRLWGVPIPAFYCKDCSSIHLNGDIIRHFANIVKTEGSDAWFKHEAKQLLPLGFKCNKCNGAEFEKGKDIMDVWFDSATAFETVLNNEKGLTFPADLFLEGSDQHRGWFQSSLLVSTSTRGIAPYKSILTNGFVVDGNGNKMGKSLGNAISPEEIVNTLGADILRLWAATMDYSGDVKISKEIIDQIVESYRKIRNTARFILGNLYDFDPNEKIDYKDLLEIDKLALFKLETFKKEIVSRYESYEFYHVMNVVNNFVVTDLSSFYLDIIKDRLYTSPTLSRERCSAQFVIYTILLELTKILAPILSFTAEEIWEHVNKLEAFTGSSVFETDCLVINNAYINTELEKNWNLIVNIKELANKELEILRKNATIGGAIEASIELELSKNFIQNNQKLLQELEEILIVSKVTITESNSDLETIKVKAFKFDGIKCQRCWRYYTKNEMHDDTICNRCIKAI